MPRAVADTSALLFLHRIGSIHLLEALFERVLVPVAVVSEMRTAERLGYAVVDVRAHAWMEEVSPKPVPSEWLALDLGAGELAAMAVALEDPEHIVLLDDGLARRIARAAGLQVWGTLRVLLEAKQGGHISAIAPLVDRLTAAGMWLSDEMRQRILGLAHEATE